MHRQYPHPLPVIAAILIGLIASRARAAATTEPASATSDAAALQQQMEHWWTDLEGADPQASRALLKSTSKPTTTVAFLKTKLKPLTIDADRVRALIAKLGSNDDAEWKPAWDELQYFDPRLAIDLETLMKEVTQSPARQRLVELLSGRPAGSLAGKKVELSNVGTDGFNFRSDRGSWWAEHRVDRLGGSSGWGNTRTQWIRAVRAIVLLEHIDTPEAAAIVREMATGHPDAQPTKVAREAIETGIGAP